MVSLKVIDACARSAHEANRVFCLALGDTSQVPWEDTRPDIQASARAGVPFALDGATPQEQHEAWVRFKMAEGWTFGPTKDAVLKTHPCLVPYDRLPPHHRAKDALYQASVLSMARALNKAGA